MPTRQNRDRDFVTVARRVVEQAIGEHLDGTPLGNPEATKNPRAVAAGRSGGQKGGKVRAQKLGSAERSQIARKAAMARWHNQP